MAEERPSNLLHIILLVYCGINVVIGLGMLACGSWFHASPEVYSYLSVFVNSAYDSSLVAAAALLLVGGLVLTIISALAIVGLILNKPVLVVVHMWMQIIVLIFGLIAGFIAVGFYWDMHYHVKQGMRDQLEQYYDDDGTIGHYWNTVQVKKRCCGIDGAWDYATSDWYNGKNPVDEIAKVHVPRSCCALNFNQDRELYWVDPEEIQLKDEVKCQEDAAGRILNSANLNRLGCFTALLQVNVDLWHDISIFTALSIFQGLGLGPGFLQLFGIAIDYVYLRSRRVNEKPSTRRRY